MFVDRKKIRIDTLTSAATIDIPIVIDAIPSDNTDLIKTRFVDNEVQKAVNPIIDYKKVRFKPAVVDGSGVWTIVPEIKIKLEFFNKQTPPVYSGFYSSLGFTNDDLFCRANRVMKSFLTLNYYKTTNPTDNVLLTSSNIFTQIGDDQKDVYGNVLKANQSPISYELGDPTLKPEMVHEGFHIYWYEELVKSSPNNEYVFYLSPTYQNADNGEVSIVTPVKSQLSGSRSANNTRDLGGEDGTQYIKVILKYDETDGKFKYSIGELNDSQLKDNGGGIDWNTNDEGVPTLTFYQLQPTVKTISNNSDNSNDVTPFNDITTGGPPQSFTPITI